MEKSDLVHIRIKLWQNKIISKLILFLAVINIIATILQYFSITYEPSVIEHLIVWGLSLFLVVVAVVKWIPVSAKGIIAIGLLYAGIIKQFFTHGLLSSSPVYLVLAPVIAFFVIGKKGGWIAVFASTVVFIFFTVLVYLQVLPGISYIHVEPLNYRVWIEIGISVIVMMMVVLLIITNYHTFVTGTVQEAIDQSTENALLEKELHHRVRNNLALMESILDLQVSRDDDTHFKDMTVKLQGRIHSLALIHEKLYGIKEKRNLDIESYIKALGMDLLILHRKDSWVEILYDIQPVKLNIDQATPLGIILNEIITNSLLHAFTSLAEGKIWITLKLLSDNLVEVSIQDNGPGFDKGDISENNTLGVKFIEILTRQLDGTIDVDVSTGVRYVIQFNLVNSI